MNTNEKKPPNLPLCLVYEDAKNDMFAAINGIMQKYNMPLFLYENVLSEALRQVQSGVVNERQTAKETYKKRLAEFQNKTETETEQ